SPVPGDRSNRTASLPRSAAGTVPIDEGEGRMAPETTETNAVGPTLERRLKRLGFTSDEDDWTDRYLLCEHAVDPGTAESRQRFEAVARFIRDLITHRWVKTRLSREEANPKRIYYLSMEFLIGRTLSNNIINMAADPYVQRALRREGWDLAQIVEQEPD